jgi:hypothetical protein
LNINGQGGLGYVCIEFFDGSDKALHLRFMIRTGWLVDRDDWLGVHWDSVRIAADSMAYSKGI